MESVRLEASHLTLVLERHSPSVGSYTM